jgi:hypothetical protein
MEGRIMTDITRKYSHEVDGVAFSCPVVSEDPDVTTFAGAVLRAYASNIATGALYSGTVAVIDPLLLDVTFPGFSLPVGDYLIQVIATPTGHASRTIVEAIWQIKRSLGPA